MPEVKVKVVEIERKKYRYEMDRLVDEARASVVAINDQIVGIQNKYHSHRQELLRAKQSEVESAVDELVRRSNRIMELQDGLKVLKQQLVAYYARCGGEHGPSGSHLKNSVDSMKQTIDDLLQGD